MADNRIKLNSLGVPVESSLQYVQIGEAVITVKHTIPYEQMLEMIQWCIDYIINDRPFISAPLKRIIKDFAVLNFFTNLDFNFMTEYRDMSEIYAEYDLVYQFDVMEKVKQFIDEKQIIFFETTLDETLNSIMDYRNSAMGIVDALSETAKKSGDSIQKAVDLLNEGDNAEKISDLLHFAEQIQG